MRGLALSIAVACGAALWPLAAAADGPCRQALAFGLDVSGSVDATEYRLQLDGLAAALTDPDVARALLAAPAAPVRLAAYEWSGPDSQHLIADWTEITNAAALAGFVRQLETHRRRARDPATALGRALAVGAEMLARQPACWQHTLDISGDGGSNTGPAPQDLHDTPALAEITVNALVVGGRRGDDGATAADRAGAEAPGPDWLLGYFETYVIHGPGAFAEHATDYSAYETAMIRKLLRELHGLVVGTAP